MKVIQFSKSINGTFANTVVARSEDADDDLRADRILEAAGLKPPVTIYTPVENLEQAKAVLRLNGFEIEESE